MNHRRPGQRRTPKPTLRPPPPAATHRPLRTSHGAATAEFVLVSFLLLLLFTGALHLGLALHVRNLAQDAAVHAARYGALADRGPADGKQRAHELLHGSLNGGLAPKVEARSTGIGEAGGITVEVTTALPLFGILPGPHLIKVEASASRGAA
ncbi:MAG: TadE/TadG family type IV pilus assembly protein [Galactobacter sp.]